MQREIQDVRDQVDSTHIEPSTKLQWSIICLRALSGRAPDTLRVSESARTVPSRSDESKSVTCCARTGRREVDEKVWGRTS